MAVAATEKRIVLADVMGYCWGVRRALEIIQQAARQGPVATVGDVIHNPQVVERLRIQGIEPVGSVQEARERGFRRVAITAHGAGPQRAQEAQEAGLELIDTTCPLVTKVQRLAENWCARGTSSSCTAMPTILKSEVCSVGRVRVGLSQRNISKTFPGTGRAVCPA